MEMRAQLSQQDLAFVRAGMPASVTPIGTDRSFSGQVWQVAPVIDPQIAPGRSPHLASPTIRPSGRAAFAEARIGAGATTAPLLPQSAVLSDDKGNYVYIVNRKNEVERRADQDRNGQRRRRHDRGRPERPGSGRPVGRTVPQPWTEGLTEAPARSVNRE